MRKVLLTLGVCAGATAYLHLLLEFAESSGWITPEVQPILYALSIVSPAMVIVIHALLQMVGEKRNAMIRSDNRAALIETVRTNWIEGVLEETLKDARFDVNVTTRATQAGDVRDKSYELPKISQEKTTAITNLINTVLRRNGTRKQ